MSLGVTDELKKLEGKLEKIRDVLDDAENKKLQDKAISHWQTGLREVMYDAGDIIDECRIEGWKVQSSKQLQPSKLNTPLLMNGNRGRNLVYAIVGMGGIGKTSLAQKIFSTEQIKAHFDIKIWVCVSQDFVGIHLLKQIIRCVGGYYGDAKTKAELDPLVVKGTGLCIARHGTA
uniref:Disease resistance protein RGA4 n=1 Tax=Elaeis guineensis var. tenera TaxID=51953 RepID=A0A6J0PQJ0_ELAGV|nr:putative disease resistance protein RGA4 [Elaeis guineensis]